MVEQIHEILDGFILVVPVKEFTIIELGIGSDEGSVSESSLVSRGKVVVSTKSTVSVARDVWVSTFVSIGTLVSEVEVGTICLLV